MKKKIKLQKIVILLFMTFAVFNYNNCEFKIKGNSDQAPGDKIDPNIDGTTEVRGEEEITISSGDNSNNSGSEIVDNLSGTETNGDNNSNIQLSYSEKYQLLTDAYNDSNLHSILITSCGGCHHSGAGASGTGPHGDSDVAISLNDLLTYNSLNFGVVGKIDLSKSDNSILYKYVANNHKGLSGTAPTLLTYIDEFISSYESLAEIKLAEKIAAASEGNTDINIDDGGGEIIPPVDPSSNVTLDDFQLISEPIVLSASTSVHLLTLPNVGSISIESEYLSEQGYYILKNPIINTNSGHSFVLTELRGIINETYKEKYGTWTSINDTFNSGEIVGHGTLFVQAINIGEDTLQFAIRKLVEN